MPDAHCRPPVGAREGSALFTRAAWSRGSHLLLTSCGLALHKSLARGARPAFPGDPAGGIPVPHGPQAFVTLGIAATGRSLCRLRWEGACAPKTSPGLPTRRAAGPPSILGVTLHFSLTNK